MIVKMISFIIFFLLSAIGVAADKAPNNNHNINQMFLSHFCGRVTGVVPPKNNAKKIKYISLTNENNTSDIHSIKISDYRLIYSIQMAQNVHFRDVLSDNKNLNNNFELCFEGVELENLPEGLFVKNYSTIKGGIFTDSFPLSALLESVFPNCPDENENQHYVDVPISYAHPEWGTFKLFYETSANFDPNLPTMILVSDGQQQEYSFGFATRTQQEMERVTKVKSRYNIVTYAVRGITCSSIEGYGLNFYGNWERAYEIFNSDNMVEDIESIRRDLLPSNEKIYIFGASGTSFLNLKYISKYHQNVGKSVVVSGAADSTVMEKATKDFFNSFLKKEDLQNEFQKILKEKIVSPEQLNYIILRELYTSQETVKLLIHELAEGKTDLYKQLFSKHQDVKILIKSFWYDRPGAAVWMSEVNSPDDLNWTALGAKPIFDLVEKGILLYRPFQVKNLEQIDTDVFIVAGTLDQVVPVNSTWETYKQIPNSQLAIFKDYHVLPYSAVCRQKITMAVFNYGSRSEELQNVFQSEDCRRFCGMSSKDISFSDLCL